MNSLYVCLPHIGKGSADLPIRVLPSEKERSVSLSDLTEGLNLSLDVVGSKGCSQEAELSLINEGFPPIPTKVVQKIEKGDYVDLKELLPQKPVVEDSPLMELLNGVVVLASPKQLKPQRKPIQDLATWMQAFMVFVAIRNRKFPESTNDLLAYGALIARGARDYRGSGWLSYDFQFRRLAAARGSATKWAEKDVSLWNETVGKSDLLPVSPRSGQSYDQEKKGAKRPPFKGAPGQPPVKKPKGKDKSWKQMVCYQFSYTGKCTREKCEYLHVCYESGRAMPSVHAQNKPIHNRFTYFTSVH